MSSCVYGVLVKPPPERETLQGGWHADWVRCPQASLARRSFVCRARGRELGIAMAVAKLYLARMLQRTLPAGLNGDDLGREPIEFNARGGALPDCLVNTHHYCPGDNPLKMALRSICGPACGALTVGHVDERYWRFVGLRGKFRCPRVQRERNCHAIYTDHADARICSKPKGCRDRKLDRTRRCAEAILNGPRREWSAFRARNIDGGRWCYR